MAARTKKAATPKAILPAEITVELIEKIASDPAPTTLVVNIGKTTEKLVTDRIRRIPRIKGFSALTVKRTDQTGDVITLVITSTQATATPWPTRDAVAVRNHGGARDKTAKKAPAAKKAAPAKSAAKKAPAKTPAKKAAPKSKAKLTVVK